MFAYFEVLRPLNCLMTAIAILIGAVIVAGSGLSILTAPIWLAMLAGFIITGAGNAINDYIDTEADKINRPDRPIPSGRASAKGILFYSIILFIVGIILAGFINYVTFLIAIINSIILVIYSKILQNKLLIGNLAVSYLVGSAFLFGGAVPSPLLFSLVAPSLFALLAFLSNMAREIIKDMEDFEGDKQSFLKRMTSKVKEAIAERFGIETGEMRYKKELKAISSLSLLAAIAISPLPYLWDIFSINYLCIVWITDLLFLWAIVSVYRAKSSRQYRRISKKIKVGMLFGLIAFLVGALV